MDDSIFYRCSLDLVIYTIGYEKEGESVIALIKTDGIVVFSMVIDGYKNKKHNASFDILENEKVANLDFFCWSHPDKDHSLGIEDYIKLFTNKTTIIVGDGFSDTTDKWRKANTIMYDYITRELELSSRSKDKIKIRKADTGMKLVKREYRSAETSISSTLEVESFAPSDSQVLRRKSIEQVFDNNFMSVGLTLKLGEKVAVFCSDVSSTVFNQLGKEDLPSIVDYIKIPHHCSSSSNSLIKKISNKPSVACTTVNVSNHLPDRTLLKKYTEIVTNVFCTNDLSHEMQCYDYGVQKTVINIDRNDYIKFETYGNAKMVSYI